MTGPNVPEPYVERMRFTPLLVSAAALFLALGAVSVWLATDPQFADRYLRISMAVLGGGCLAMGLSILSGALRQRVALRVDQYGVTLGRPPGLVTHHGLWWRTPLVRVPWRDIDAVVLFTLDTPRTLPLSFVGLRLRAGAPLPRREPVRAGAWRRASVWLGQEPPPRDVSLYRQVLGWRIDEGQLRRAARAHARAVRVITRN